MFHKVLLMMFAVLSVFGADREVLDPSDPGISEHGVETTLVRNEHGTYMHIKIDVVAHKLEKDVKVAFGITDDFQTKHALYDLAFTVAELQEYRQPNGQIKYETIVPVDAQRERELVAGLVEAGLLTEDTEANHQKSAGSFTAYARATQTYIWKIDEIRTCTEAYFNCTGCIIVSGTVCGSMDSNPICDSCSNCAPPLEVRDCTFDLVTTAEAWVNITNAQWSSGGSLYNYYLYDSL